MYTSLNIFRIRNISSHLPQDPYLELMLWAVLSRRGNLAKFLWERCNSPLCAAVVASCMYQALWESLGEKNTDIRQEYQLQKKVFQNLAKEVRETSLLSKTFSSVDDSWDGLFVNLTLTSELEVIMKFLIFPAPVIEFSAKFPDLNQLLASNPSKYFLKNTKSFLLTQLPLHRHNVFPASCWTCVTKQTRPMPWASSSGGTPGGANWPASSWPTSPTTSSSLRPRAPRRPSSSTGGEAWRRHPILLLLSRTSFPYLYFGRNSSSECLVWFTLMIEGDK